jgi:hypothetical protein
MQDMTIDPSLQIGNFLLVPNNRDLPGRCVIFPTQRVNNVGAHPYRTLMDGQDCYDSANSLHYTQDLRIGSVKAVSMTSFSRKGELADIMV